MEIRRLVVGLTLPTAGVLLACLSVFPGPQLRGDDRPAKKVRIGLVNTLFRDESEKQIQVIADPFEALLKEYVGIDSQIVLGGAPEQLAVQLKENKFQLGLFNGFEFALARRNNAALKPLVIAIDRQRFARAVLVVRQDNKASDPAALQGEKLALPQLAREHCRLFVEHRCAPRGAKAEKWFAKIVTPRTAHDSLDDVAENYAQAAVVDDVDLAAFRKAYPKTGARLRILAESAKFPCAVVGYLPGSIDEATLARLRVGLLGAKLVERGRTLMELCRITGFEAVPDDYEKSLTDILEAYPPTK